MIREISTILVDNISTQYYISFRKDRQWFNFQAALKNKDAPSFTIYLQENHLVVEPHIDEAIARQAKEKVKEIVSDSIFDRI